MLIFSKVILWLFILWLKGFWSSTVLVEDKKMVPNAQRHRHHNLRNHRRTPWNTKRFNQHTQWREAHYLHPLPPSMGELFMCVKWWRRWLSFTAKMRVQSKNTYRRVMVKGKYSFLWTLKTTVTLRLNKDLFHWRKMSNSVPFIKRKMLLLKALKPMCQDMHRSQTQTGHQKKKSRLIWNRSFLVNKKKKGKENLKDEETHCN